MYRNILLGIVIALTVILLIVMFLLGDQWYYEGQGDEHFRKGSFEDAAVSYTRALGDARFLGQARLMYKIGLAYENNKDFDRARDYYIELIHLYPDSPMTPLIGPRVEKMFKLEMAPPDGRPIELGTGGLAEAMTKFRRAFQGLMTTLQANRAGVSPELEAAYASYKIFQAEYKRQVALALQKYKEEHPGFVWPPPGAMIAPDPVAVDASAPVTTPVKAPPRPVEDVRTPREPEEPPPPRAETRPSEVERELSGAGGPVVKPETP